MDFLWDIFWQYDQIIPSKQEQKVNKRGKS